MPTNNVYITAQTFYDEFTGTGGGGASYMNGGVLSKMIARTDFYTYLAFTGKQLTFDSATKTITSSDTNDFANFIAAGWLVGMTIEVEDTASNDGTYTITAVSATVITVAEALVNEMCLVGSIYDDTPVTALDFYYNLIGNDAQESYVSLTDKGNLQRFTVDGLDATDTVTLNNMLVSSKSFGWVTNELVDADTGETDEVTVVGMGITDHKQKFRIEQVFMVAPIWLRSQVQNFTNITAPDYYAGINSLKYISRVDAKFDANDPDIPYTGSLTSVSGKSNWFNDNNVRARPDYYLESITYTNAATTEDMDRLDVNVVTEVVITLRSRAGKFVDGDTPLNLDFFLCPKDEADYSNTETTLRQNLVNDRLAFLLGDASADGEYVGTDYQAIKDVVSTFTDANELEIAFTIDLAQAVRDRLIANPDSDRYYAIVVTTQDEAITTTVQTDRVPVLCDFQLADYNRENPDLLEAVEGFSVYAFPNTTPEADVSGWEGDPFYARFPFRVETTEVDDVAPTLLRAGMQIVAVKDGEDDFVIEEKIFDTSLVKRLCGIQDISITEERSFNTPADDPYKINSLLRDSDYDSGTMKGYEMTYAFALRYEYWLNIIRDAEQFQYPVFNRCDDDAVTEAWKTVVADGWTLQLRFTADVKGYDDYVTTYQADTLIRLLASGANGDELDVTAVTKYYNRYGVEVSGVVKGDKTKLVTTYTGDFSSFPTGYSGYSAYVFMDVPGDGSINLRRFASTEQNAESDSPFSSSFQCRSATSYTRTDNITLNVIDATTIVLSTYYDDSLQNWATQYDTLLYGTRLTLKRDGEMMTFEDGAPMLYEDETLMLN